MIGQRLKVARTAAGLSLRDLQGKIGNLVSAQMIGRYEHDEAMPGSAVLIALADALAVSETYLLDESELQLEFDRVPQEPHHESQGGSLRRGDGARRGRALSYD